MTDIRKVEIYDEYITLAQFLKIVDLISSGGKAKDFILLNKIFINNIEENRRGRKLYKGDLIKISSKEYEIC